MRLSKPLKNQRLESIDWLTFINDDHAKLVIPVGPRFQVEVPPWTPPNSRSFENSKWLGTQTWPVKGRNSSNRNMIGRGRLETCQCAFPGSIECVRKHVSHERFQLKIELGPVFWIWKFDEMGENVSKSWKQKEEKRFEYIAKMNATSQGKNSLVESALESFPGKTRGSIVSYYLNVYIPRRIRSSCITIDDDDGGGGGDDGDNMLCLKGPGKRLQAKNFNSRRCKYAKNTYLTY